MQLVLPNSPTHRRMQSLDSTGTSTAATTPATPTAGGFGATSPIGTGASGLGQQSQPQQQQQQQQQPSSLFSGKAGVPSNDTAAATSPRPSAATTPVTMFGDTLLHHRTGKQVGSSLQSSLDTPQVSLESSLYPVRLICKSAFCYPFYLLTFESREKVFHVSINIMIEIQLN